MWKDDLKVTTRLLIDELASTGNVNLEVAEYGELDWDEITMHIPLSKLTDHLDKVNGCYCCILTQEDADVFNKHLDELQYKQLGNMVDLYCEWLSDSNVLKDEYRIGPFLVD